MPFTIAKVAPLLVELRGRRLTLCPIASPRNVSTARFPLAAAGAKWSPWPVPALMEPSKHSGSPQSPNVNNEDRDSRSPWAEREPTGRSHSARSGRAFLSMK
jgi:hypothetical protein